MSHTSIVLIGPYLSGKSTIRRLLAESLGLPQCSLHLFENDALLLRYYCEGGYDESQHRHLAETDGNAADRYVKSFDAYAVERCLVEHPGHIIEVGPPISVYDDEAHFARAHQALEPYPNVVLLIPAPDHEESYRVLRERYLTWLRSADFNNTSTYGAYRALAKHTVYSKDKTPEEVRDEVVRIVAPDGTPRTPILLIGPPVAGKSTTSNLLEVALKIPAVGMDVVGWDYMSAAGFDEEKLERIREREGDRAARHYEQEIRATAMIQAVTENQGAIIDFGAGHTIYDDAEIFARFSAALVPYPSVILLLPSPDPTESAQILENRPRSTIDGIDANKYIILHHSNYDLAKLVVYTEGKTPEETRDEILDRLRLPRDPGRGNSQPVGGDHTLPPLAGN